MPREDEWVKGLRERIAKELGNVKVFCHKKLPYAHEIFSFEGEKAVDMATHPFQTDLLIAEGGEGNLWTPRVVVECKLSSVTTHDALTYSAKAAAHKQVCPYLRYGILVGNLGDDAVPGRLLRHGAHFDFMVTWSEAEPAHEQWAQFTCVLTKEIEASRTLHALLADTRCHERQRYSVIHRRLWAK